MGLQKAKKISKFPNLPNLAARAAPPPNLT